MSDDEFQKLVRQKGKELYRPMPWRDDTRPYYVLVSELMLQQTQVSRVIPKFNEFIERFPNEKSLASASLGDVLKLWQSLGYNRRAKFLHEAVRQLEDRFPDTFEKLVKLPGVGKNTAGAILAYSFNEPILFVETNIRTVYIHHFFADNFDVDDKQILQKLAETVPWAKGKEQPERRIHSAHGAMRKTVGLSYGPKAFYYALMDYGSWLKANGVRNNIKSKHYKKQPPLKGSVREVRGMILKKLSERDMNVAELEISMPKDERFSTALEALISENMIVKHKDTIHLTK